MRRATLKEISEQSEQARKQHGEVAVDFIRIELELADTFCKLALDSRSPERARQHRVNARRALDSAFHALANVNLEKKELEIIVTRIEEVKALLESLEAGGSVHPSC